MYIIVMRAKGETRTARSPRTTLTVPRSSHGTRDTDRGQGLSLHSSESALRLYAIVFASAAGRSGSHRCSVRALQVPTRLSLARRPSSTEADHAPTRVLRAGRAPHPEAPRSWACQPLKKNTQINTFQAIKWICGRQSNAIFI